MPLQHPLNLLLVEDSLSDIDLVTEILEESDSHHHLHIVRDGEEALLFLYRQGQHKSAVRPDLVLLDLNLPKRNGYEVLAEIKANPALRQIPVIVFTTSDRQPDIVRAYDLHANAYMLKSSDYQAMLNAVQSVQSYWLSTVKLPPTP